MSENTPSLESVRDEITAIIKKHDLTGMIVLQDCKRGVHSVQLQATWNATTHEDKGTIRIKADSASGPVEEAEKLKNSVGSLLALMDVLNNRAKELEGLAMEIAKQVKFEHMTKFE